MKNLINIADRENITIKYVTMPTPYLGMYLNDYGSPLILLDHGIKDESCLHRCILAEELGHHFTSVGKSIHYAETVPFWKQHQAKQEFKALKWSATNLIPYDKLIEAYCEGLQELFELAHHFKVTPELMQFRMTFVNKNDFQIHEVANF